MKDAGSPRLASFRYAVRGIRWMVGHEAMLGEMIHNTLLHLRLAHGAVPANALR